MDQRDLRFCKNDGSKRSYNNEKGGQQDRKTRRNWYKLLQKCQMTDICEKYNNFRSKIISGTKCDRDKRIFSAKREGQYDRVRHNKETQWDR